MDERTADPARLALSARDEAGLSAFFIHAEALRRGDVDLVRRSIVEKGFDVLVELDMSEGRLEALGRVSEVNCADVAAVLIAYDLLPIPPADTQRAKGHGCSNDRNRIATSAATKEVNRQRTRRSHYHPLSGSAAGDEAWAVLRALTPDRIDDVGEMILSRRSVFATPPPLQELSSVACRAKVELVRHYGALAVRKTFRPGAERYLQRELNVFHRLGPHSDAIPQLLEHGSNYLIMEYVDVADQLGIPNGESIFPLPLKHVRELADFVRTCVAHGFDPIDLKPDGNTIFTRRGLKIIDYEYWRPCPPGTRPEESCSLAGLPEDFDGDRPMGLPAVFRPYPTKWILFTGLPLRSFLYDPAWLQLLKRVPWPAIAALRRAVQFAVRRFPGRDSRLPTFR